MLTLIQALVLGIVQGITEWIPISSSASLVWVMSNLYGITDPELLIRAALFFHLGTFFAALIYFRKEVAVILKTLFKYKYSDETQKRTLKFLIFSTIISGAVGIVILKTLWGLDFLNLTGKGISLVVGILLFFTGIIQIKVKRRGLKKPRDLLIKDGILLGVAQGVSALPGLSRSGITVSTLLLRKFDDTTALRLSFLMSLPIILFGNIILNLEDFVFTSVGLVGLISSFILGFLTIHLLMKTSRKINFGWFVLGFAILMMLSVLV